MNNKLYKYILLGVIILVGGVIAVYGYNKAVNYQDDISGAAKKQSNIDYKNKNMIIKTNFGNITLELFEKDAPKTVANFKKLAEQGFYDETKFHRVIKGFMIQGGDPNSKSDDWSTHGRGGPGYTFADEFNQHKLVRGVLAMANSGPNTNGSQFFIVTAEATPWLDGKHTAFGRVVEGMDVVDKIENTVVNENDHPVDDVKIIGIEIK